MSNTSIYSRAARELTAVLQRMADEAGWSGDATGALSVAANGEELSVVVEKAKEPLVNCLEYGTEEMPPKPVLRKFKANLPVLITPFILEDLEQSLDEGAFKV